MINTFRHIAFALALGAASASAQTIDTAATTALIVDYDTGAVLLERNADTPIPPASMSKLMTLNMLFEAVQDGRVGLDTVFPVSENAHGFGGSTMFLETRHDPTVEDLIRGIVVLSGNDACIVVAEHLAGSETAFADRMTIRARELGMMDSTFANATGWPHPDHRMSGRDLVFIGRRMIDEFGEFYPYFAEQEFTWNDITQPNRNPLLGAGIGGDGLKTGHTEEAGFGLVGSAEQDGRRIVFVISGLDSSSARTTESERLTRWAFREFENVTFFDAGETVAQAEIWLGETDTVPLVAANSVMATLPRGQVDGAVARVSYDGPVEAPIAAGDHIADLIITTSEDVGDIVVPLVAGADVAEGGAMVRVMTSARMMAGRALGSIFGSD
ncbi:D-alanyl-D-alanine carboxypeptidase family protein [Pontivivens insulae]|uniref:serine-type D-Ala-D-Ala carboxypeptidase n=1 Tax=Pontivivens insulae TaxID=1639689 RepID=A0A2R8AFT4_9RHOB|nr:D-alanyl-D-alanine carboxypeptidase family protein [Pontivivens insulae]RED12169.1 D-alanyl-D-alanine carboxypeptidase (penicillin-binding protein 5/6) [Pontivivens insulae]SPF30925.1 D-alanyl-D-alanine carboxypeptidase DacC [Pontivivens insulae]